MWRTAETNRWGLIVEDLAVICGNCGGRLRIVQTRMALAQLALFGTGVVVAWLVPREMRALIPGSFLSVSLLVYGALRVAFQYLHPQPLVGLRFLRDHEVPQFPNPKTVAKSTSPLEIAASNNRWSAVRVHLSYFDHTEPFRRALPESGLTGRVVRRIALQGVGNDWALLALDQPFEYEDRRHDVVLLKSRWEGYKLGGPEPTSVFIVLIPDASVLDKAVLDSKDFEHVAWGMARTYRSPNNRWRGP